MNDIHKLGLINDIYKTFVSEGMPHDLANLMCAQVMHESNRLTSKVFKNNNNLNGYKWVKGAKLSVRGTKSPEGDFYAKYATPLVSAVELAGWIKRRQAEGIFPQDLTTIKQPIVYATLLKAGKYYGKMMRDGKDISVENYALGLKTYLRDYSLIA